MCTVLLVTTTTRRPGTDGLDASKLLLPFYSLSPVRMTLWIRMCGWKVDWECDKSQVTLKLVALPSSSCSIKVLSGQRSAYRNPLWHNVLIMSKLLERIMASQLATCIWMLMTCFMLTNLDRGVHPPKTMMHFLLFQTPTLF